MVKELETRRVTRSRCCWTAMPAAWWGARRRSRAAGSILQAHHRRGRRCALVVNSAARETQAIATDANWRRALEILAAAEPTARTPAFALLQADGGMAARSLELVVVTSRIDVPLVDRLVQRALSRRGVSLVYVEAAPGPQPQLLRLQAVGIPVAIVRSGDDLRLGSARRRRGCVDVVVALSPHGDRRDVAPPVAPRRSNPRSR